MQEEKSEADTTQPSVDAALPHCQPSEDASISEGSKDMKQQDLCRKMGTMFLQHRVDQLNDDVKKMHSRRHRQKRGHPGKYHDDALSGISSLASSASSSRTALTATLPQAPSDNQDLKTLRTAHRVIIVDSSLLIYSLRTVHDWLKGDRSYRIVIPAEALNTLDVLKKGDHILNLAARKATRFLEERSHDPALVLQPRGAWVRATDEKLEHLDQDVLRSIVQNTDKDIPNPIKETLLCVFHFMSVNDVPNGEAESPCSLAISLPPPHLDSLSCASETDLRTPGLDQSSDLRYASRVDGTLLLSWAKKCGLPSENIIVAPTAASWLAASTTTIIRRTQR